MFITGGREVPPSDVVLVLSVSIASVSDYKAFLEDNRRRIHESLTAGDKDLSRHERAGTEEVPFCTVVLSFFDPPGQSRSQFVMGRDPRCCDIICANPPVSNQHIKIGFEGDHMVLYDVSTRGSLIALGEGKGQWTFPERGDPFRCILPPGCKMTVSFAGYEFKFEMEHRQGAALDEFRQKRDAFLANCSDVGGLNIASQIPTQLATPAPSGKRKHMYWYESELGRGGFGVVHRVRRLHDWTALAAKRVLDRNPDSESDTHLDTERRRLKKEMKTLQSLRHERIVQYVDWYEDMQDSWILVMEYCQYGSLQHMIATAEAPFTAHEVADILKQAAEGLLYLHGQGTTHRDLKPHNILIRSRSPLSLALCDFGLAKKKIDDDSFMETACGTYPYMAPEIWSDGFYTRAVDIWALGVVGIQLLLRGLPRLDKKGQKGYPEVIFAKAEAMQKKDPRDPLLGNVRKMLAWDPRDRPQPDECIRDAKDVLEPTTSASAPAQDPVLDGKPPSVSSSQTPRSSEIRLYEERYFQTSGWRAVQDGPAATPAQGKPLTQPRGDADAPSGSNSPPTTKLNITQKRGINALPRSNSMEAPASKVPRIEEQCPQPPKAASPSPLPTS
jgi:serine/threonine protein kinase